uniref:Uncharacterized protein n=1 Tax=Leersia perrieri TaxID=77586 RepID=A0A0D9XG90_9ORYZ
MAGSPADCAVQNVSLDTLFLIVIQAAAVVVIGKFIHLSLRRHNLPSAISQIIAGIMVGSLGLHEMIVHVDVENVEDTYGWYVSEARIFYMFYVGLDADLAALWNDARRCTAATYASVATCLLLAAFVSGGIYGSMMHTPVKSPELLAAVLMLTLANTASVDVSRMAAELKLSATDSGRLAVSAAIASNVICIVGEGVFSCMKLASSKTPGYTAAERLGMGILALVKVGIAMALLKPAVGYINRRNARKHRVGSWELVILLLAVSFIGNFPEHAGFDGMPASFVLGLAFPREGPVARSVMDAVAYPLHAVALPFYFGAMGMRINFAAMSGAIVVPAVLLTILGLVGKCAGTIAAARYLKMPIADAIRLGMLLNVKGNVNMIDMSFASSEGIWAEQALMAMVVGSIMSTVIAGPVFAVMFRKERDAYACADMSLERRMSSSSSPDAEIRMLACVHGARGAPAMLGIVELMAAAPRSQPTIHVLHMFDAEEDDEDAAARVNCVVDVFITATGLSIRQIDVGDRGAAVNARNIVGRCAEDVRAGILMVPYHREQRHDGAMVCRREGRRRELNREVLDRAAACCTVAVLADRPFWRGGSAFRVPTRMSRREETTTARGIDRNTAIATVFLGGPDDREAVAFACRLARNDAIKLTLIRLVLRLGDVTRDVIAEDEAHFVSDDGGEEALSVVVDGGGDDEDVRCVAAFRREYVAKEKGEYEEKAVGGPVDVVEALRGGGRGEFALMVVGRGGRQPPELVVGLERWAAECAEVGPVGEILATDGSLEMGSVLVVQQKTPPLSPFHLDMPPAV